MLDALFPGTADNAYRGNRVALILLGMLAALKLLIGMRSMFDPVAVAQGADGIPLNTFAPAAAHEVVSMFGLLGMHFVITALLCCIVLWRYRSLVPLMFAVQLVERGIHWLLERAHPGAPANPNAPGDIVSWIVLLLIACGFVLSLWRVEDRRYH